MSIIKKVEVSIASLALPSQTIGDIVYASSASSLTRLADVAVGSVLVSGGVATAPAWSASPTVASIALSGATAINANIVSTGVIADKTDFYENLNISREVSTAVTVTDTYNLSNLVRTNISNNAGATLNAQGSVQKITNVRTQTLGTCTDTVVVQKLIQDSGSTGNIYTHSTGATQKAALTVGGNFLLGAQTAAGTNALGVLALSNGATAPTTSTDMVQLYGQDLSAGNATLGLKTETSVAADIALASTDSLTVFINGLKYKILLTLVP